MPDKFGGLLQWGYCIVGKGKSNRYHLPGIAQSIWYCPAQPQQVCWWHHALWCVQHTRRKGPSRGTDLRVGPVWTSCYCTLNTWSQTAANQDLSPKIKLPVLELSIMKAWFNFALMDYCTFIYAGGSYVPFLTLSHFYEVCLESLTIPVASDYTKELSFIRKPIFSLHLTWQILQPSHSLHLNQISISQMPVISCDMLRNFPTDSTGDLGDGSFFFLASNILLLTASRQRAGFLHFRTAPSYLPYPSLETKYPHTYMCLVFSCCDVKTNCIVLAIRDLRH